MDRRKQRIKERKSKIKNLIKREGDKSYKFLVFAMIIGLLNWGFWHDQFIGLDFKYYLFFVALPLLMGIGLYYITNRNFIKNFFNTKAKNWLDALLSYGFLLTTALFFSYVSIVTLANVVFKLSMDISTEDKPFINKTYVVTATNKNDGGRRRSIHFYSQIYYLDETNQCRVFDVNFGEVETSRERRKIAFQCQKGFWGFYKIIDYNIN